MSWFDSSFSFAKTALSQAQRSIDRVLDIQEEAGGTSQGQGHGSGALSSASPTLTTATPTSASATISTPKGVSTTPSTSANADTTSPTIGTSASPKHGTGSESPFSSLFRTKESEPAGVKPQASAAPDQHVHSAPSYKASESFGSSTWASGDSFWNPYLSGTAAVDKKENEEPASLRKKTKATSSPTVKKLPTPVTPSGRVEHPKSESTPTGLKSPIMSSTPVTEPATKSVPVKKVEESPSTKPVSQDKQTAKPGEPSTRRSKQHKTTKLPGRSQGDSDTKSKGMMKLKTKLSSPSSVTGRESPVRTQNGSETNTGLRTDTDNSHTGVDVPDSGSTRRDATGGDESTLKVREAVNSCVPSPAMVPVVDDSSVARKSSRTGHEKFGDTLEEETPQKKLSGEKDGILSGGVPLNYVTQALLPKPQDRAQDLDPNSEGERSVSSSLNNERCLEGTSKRSDFASTLGPGRESQEQAANFSDVQLQVIHVSPQSGGGFVATGKGEAESGVPRPKVERDDQLSKEIEDKPGREHVHVASPEPDHARDTTSSKQDKFEQTAPSGASQSSSSPSPDALKATGSAATPAESHLPVSTRNVNSCFSDSPTTESKMETAPTGPEIVQDEKAPSYLPQRPASNLEGSAVPVTVEEEEEEEGGRGTGKEGGGDQPPAELNAEEELDRLREELSRVGKVLEVRENRMVDMSRENITLMEANQSLQKELEEAHRTGLSDVEELRQEFTRRIASLEKKLQTVVKERDSLRKQLLAVQNEHKEQKKSAEEGLTDILREKEEQIAQLMDEGEKLSIQQLQSSKTIKNLRAKLKENDQLLAAQRQQIEDCENEIRRLKEMLKKREENERKYQESLSQLNTIAEQQAKELLVVKSERDDLSDKVRSLQSNLDSTFRELAEVRKANAVTQSVAQEAALSAEQTAREELTGLLSQQRVEAMREKESLLMQVNELRLNVSRTEQQTAWREDHLRQEVANMQQRLQEAEGRNQELTSSISQATRPLLRQIENLQTAHSTQSANWEKVEASLTQRLVEAQTQLNMSSEKERGAVEKYLTLQSRVGAMETQLGSLRQEKSQLLATLELERAKLETLEEGQQRESARMEALRSSYQQSMEDLRKEKEMLERQLEYERVRLEAESRKACLESQEKERLRSQLANSLTSVNRSVSRQSSSGSVHNKSQSEILEKSVFNGGSGSVSIVDDHTHTHSASASVIEHFQALLKQKEGELANSQNLVSSLERSRAAMVEDLATLSAQNEALTAEVNTIPQLKEKLQDVQHHHEALLQMYGERAEETEELKMDIQDLKSMYRQQIDELMSGKR